MNNLEKQLREDLLFADIPLQKTKRSIEAEERNTRYFAITASEYKYPPTIRKNEKGNVIIPEKLLRHKINTKIATLKCENITTKEELLKKNEKAELKLYKLIEKFVRGLNIIKYHKEFNINKILITIRKYQAKIELYEVLAKNMKYDLPRKYIAIERIKKTNASVKKGGDPWKDFKKYLLEH